MKRLISLLLLITMGLALCACDAFTVTFNPNQFTTNETSSDGTTPEIPGTLVDPTAVSFEIVPSTEYSFSFRVVIQSEAEDAYIDLKTFFNEFLSQSFFDGITYDEMLEDFDWFVDNKLADGTTKLFNNIVISFNLKIDGSQSPEETSSEPEVTTPEVTTPEVTTPEVTTPEVTTPEVTAPEVTTPEVTTPEVTTPEVTTPEVTTPEVTTPSTPETPDKPATIIPQVVEKPVANTGYKYFLKQSNINQTLYFTGLMENTYYLGTTTNPTEAVDVGFEPVEGKDGEYYLYFMDGAIKTYIVAYEGTKTDGSKVASLKLSIHQKEANVWTFNTEHNTPVAKLNIGGVENTYYIGAYNTFQTLSLSKISYLPSNTSFAAQFATLLNTSVISDADKVAAEKEALTIKTEIKEDCVIELPVFGSVFEQVRISWASNNEFAVINGNTLTVTQQKDVQTVTLTATITSGDITDTKKFTVTITAIPTAVPQIVETPVAGTEYYFGLYQGNLNSLLFITGEMKGYYYETTDDIDAAIKVVLEAVPGKDGVFYLSTTVGGAKKYLNIVKSANGLHNNVVYDDTAISEYIYNTEYKTVTTVLDEETFFFGTYNTYNTFSASTIDKASGNFVAHFYKLGDTPEDPDTPDQPGAKDPAADSTLTIEQAIALGSSKEHNTYTEGKYYVTGVITEIKSTIWGNMYIKDENGTSIYVYGVYNADGSARYEAMDVQPQIGDTITVYGIIGQYNGTPQMKNVWIVAHSAEAPEETTPEETTPDEPVVIDPPAESELTVEEAIALGASKEHNTYTEGKYYVTGVITEVYNTTYGNMRITDEYGNILTLYGTWSADGSARYDTMDVQPIAGDIITVYGIIGQYGSTPQIKNGWIVAHEATAPSVPEETTPEETTPIPDVPVDPDTPVALDSIGFQFILPIESYSYIFRAIIDADDGAHIDLESFFNLTLSPALFGDMTFDEVPEGINWYVDGKLAQASTQVFSGCLVSFKAANSEDTTPPTLPETPIAPDNIGFRFISSSSNKVTFRAIIDADDGTCVDLATFVESIIAPIMFGEGVTYEQSLAEGDWFVDDQSADAVTKLFSGSTVIFVEKDAPAESPEDDDGKTTIVFYHTMGSALREVLDTYIEEFNKLYPDIIVEHKQVGGYDDVCDQIKTEIVSGTHPNIAYCYPDHVALYNIAKAVQPLDDLIGSTNTVTRADGTLEQIGLTQEQINNFIDAFYNEGRAFGDGLMYTMPMSKSTEVLYYNKTFFEKHNIKVPTTWDEMEAVCEQLKAIDPDCIPLGYDSEANWFITMCEQYGSPYTSATGDHFLFDNETNRNFVARFREWYQKGYVTTQELTGSYTSSLFTMDPSERANCYMCIASSAGAYHYRSGFEVGIAPIPQVDPTNPKVISQGPSLCIFKDADEDEVLASWLFVKFLITNVDFQAEFSMNSGYMPVLESVVEHPVYADFLENANGHEGLLMQAIKVAFEQTDAYFTSPAFVGSSEARDQVGILLQYCMCDNSAATAEGIKKAFERALEECNYQIGN